MQPKTINILYWIFTILFAALMIFSSYGSLLADEGSRKLIHDQLGYPAYFIPFTGWAKLIGSIIILIPGLRTIKEWAYAGIALSGTVDPMMSFMLIWFVPGILSYIFWKKKINGGIQLQK